MAKRAVLVRASDGTVAYRWIADDADAEPDYAEVREAVARATRGRGARRRRRGAERGARR